MLKYLFTCLGVLVSHFCLAQETNIFLIGDAGEPTFPVDENLSFLSEQLANASENDLLFFLGDNIYPKGLPDEDHSDRKIMEKKLNAQLDVIKGFKGKGFIIPGNHDWAQGRKQGWRNVLNQEGYVKKYVGKEGVFLPTGGCPGPIEMPVNETLTVIVIDYQFLFHNWDKPDDESGCGVTSATEILLQLDDIVERNKDKHLMVITHHPFYTYGVHGGTSTFKDHIFPLTQAKKNLYIPLPVIGSIYPIYRKYFGNIQDITHPKVKAVRKRVIEILNKSKDVVYASGHEHSLEYIQRSDMHFIVSGSGSKITPVKQGKYTQFSKATRGFAAVKFKDEGNASLKFWDGDAKQLLYDEKIYDKEIITAKKRLRDRPDFKGKTTKIAASQQYKAGSFKKFMLGENYRDIWETEVEIPVFDIESEKGGLDVVKKGGGQQTKSLRMQAKDGKQYVLRSIEKYAENAIPTAIRKTFAADWIQDQISASHPYGSLVIPDLADAVGIYHTNPDAVFIPADPLLGDYESTFAGLAAIYEERPNSKAAGETFFGKGDKIKSTFDVLDDLYEDHDNRVDQEFVVRNRLFDMWIGDWDRHDDQWRWVRVDDPDGKGYFYRPIPRDRDQAFFVNEGVLPKIVSRKWALPKVEGFSEKVRWAPGLSNNARYFDRSFMNLPDWNTWESQIEFLQKNLTDEVILESLQKWPKEVYDLSAERIIRGLKSRRADMKRYAKELYLFLSKEVEVVGSNKDEYFLVDRIDDQRTKVSVFKLKKNGEKGQLLYERTFLKPETKEVRLFGLSGQDKFDIKGEVKKGIKVRIISGKKEDEVIDQSYVKSGGKKTIVYDKEGAVTVSKSKETKVVLTKSNEPNIYNRKSFKYDILMPLLSLQFNPDDGVFLGAGFNYTKNNWRKPTFAARHQFLFNAAFATGSYSFSYNVKVNEVIGKWGLEVEGVNQTPFFVNNYFGLGNNSQFDSDGEGIAQNESRPIQFYRIRTERQFYRVSLFKNFWKNSSFSFGPLLRIASVEREENNFLVSPQSDVDIDKVTQSHIYGGAQTNLLLDSRDNKIQAKRGTVLKAGIKRFWGLNDLSEDLTILSGSFAFYLSPRATNLVFASRTGFEHVAGDFEFFNAATLGGRSNLRGFRRTRFYGRTSFYNNIDLRLKLLSFRSYLFPGKLGLIAFNDVGRVWQDGEDSSTLHRSWGGGFWLSPANAAVITFTLGVSADETLPAISFGYLF